MVNEWGEETEEWEKQPKRKSKSYSEVSSGGTVGNYADITGYWDRRAEKNTARQQDLKAAKEKDQAINYKNVKPNIDGFFRGYGPDMLADKPLDESKMSDRDKKKYEKVKYKLERNQGIKDYIAKKGGAGYSELWSGKEPDEGAGRIGSRLAKVGKFNPLRMGGRGEIERVGLKKAKTGIVHAGAALGQIGGAFGSAGAQSFQPVQIFTMAWKRMSVTLKWLIILVFLVVILFVPWGVLYYTGWAVGAAFMFLISLIYWAFASFFNAIAYVLVTAINAVASIIMGVIIWIVEFFMSIFMKPNYFNPSAKKYEFYWVAGHNLFDNSLLKYSDLATVPTLMVPITPAWQPWMNQILIVKLFQLVPGLQPIADAFTAVGRAMGAAFESIVVHSPPWMVILIGLLPVILVVAIGIYVYKKYSSEATL